MATPALAFAQLANECEKDGLNHKNAERISGERSKTFNVELDEVGILKLEKQHLIFVYPQKLATVGSIPLNTVGSVAARTANTKRAEAINSFAQTKHVSVFEAVELGGKHSQLSPTGESKKEIHAIQKLMSAPVIGAEGVVGVIEVCRKGSSAPAAGPDFGPPDLQKLVAIAGSLAKCFK